MSKSHLEQDLFTVEDFFLLVPDGQKADLIDGVIYMASPDTLRSDQLGGFIRILMQLFVEMKNLGKVVGSRFAFELSEIRAPEPDVAFISNRRFHLLEDRKMKGGPDVAVEIISRDSRQRDYFEKKHLYQEAGTAEYWIIDPLQKRAEFYRLQGDLYALVPLEQNRIFRSQAIPGFWLDVEWLFVDPLPRAYEKLQEIIKSQP